MASNQGSISPPQSYLVPDIDMRNPGTRLIQRNCRTERSIRPAWNFSTKYLCRRKDEDGQGSVQDRVCRRIC